MVVIDGLHQNAGHPEQPLVLSLEIDWNGGQLPGVEETTHPRDTLTPHEVCPLQNAGRRSVRHPRTVRCGFTASGGPEMEVHYRLCPLGRENNPEAQTVSAAMLNRFLESLDQRTAIGFDHTPGRQVVCVSGQLNVRKPFGPCVWKQQVQRAGCVTAATLPRHYRVANVSQTIGRELCRTGLPSKAD